MGHMVRALASLVAAAAVTAPAARAADAAPVEQVISVVRSPATGQTRIITQTKLVEEARIALVSRGAVAAAVQPLDAAALRAALEWLIDQTILADEAARLQVADVDRADVDAELRRFRERFARPEDYRAFLEATELTDEELRVTLRRMLRVQRYLDGRVARAARVREADVEAYWREHAADFDGRPLASVRDAVRAHLADQRIQSEVKAVLAELRGRTEIRILAPPGGGS